MILTLIRRNDRDTDLPCSTRAYMEKDEMESCTVAIYLREHMSDSREPPDHDLSLLSDTSLNDHYQYPDSLYSGMDPLSQYPLCPYCLSFFDHWILFRVSDLSSDPVYTHTRPVFPVWIPVGSTRIMAWNYRTESHRDIYGTDDREMNATIMSRDEMRFIGDYCDRVFLSW